MPNRSQRETLFKGFGGEAPNKQNGDLPQNGESPFFAFVYTKALLAKMIHYEDCVYFANLAAAAVEQGHTTRQVELALREIRMAAKSSWANPQSALLRIALERKVENLKRMGVIA